MICATESVPRSLPLSRIRATAHVHVMCMHMSTNILTLACAKLFQRAMVIP